MIILKKIFIKKEQIKKKVFDSAEGGWWMVN